MKSLIAVLLFALAGTASAASVAMKPPVGITGNPGSATGWTTATNFVGNFSAASFSGGFTSNVGGKMVTMPATMRLAANAGQFAVAAVRSSPAALVGSAVVAWLLTNGIEYLNGQLVVKPVIPGTDGNCYQSPYGAGFKPQFPCSIAEAESVFAQAWPHLMPNASGFFREVNGLKQIRVCSQASNTACLDFSYYRPAPQPEKVPATDADFQALASAPLPDAVATELANKDVALPMEAPQFDPKYVDEPLGDPYVDPVTGKRYQDNARVTPQSDGKTADVQTNKQEVDEEGEPSVDPETGAELQPEKQDDFCKQNPDSIACMEKGETDELDLETRSIGSMVSPVAVGGAGHCMADKTLAMSTLGRSITFTYKPICDLASMVRPLILALAWLLAGWIMIGAVKEN